MKISSLFKDTFLYGVTKYLGYISAILLTPIYLKIFSKEAYGALDAYHTWTNFIIMLLPLGILNSIERYFLEKTVDKKKLVGTTFVVLLINCLIYVLLILIFKDYFLNFFKLTGYENVFYYTIALVVLTIISDTFLQILRIQLRSKPYTLVTVSNFLILTLVGFSFVYFFDTGIIGLFYGGILGLIISNLIAIFYLRNDLSLSYDKIMLKKIFSFGVHYLVVSLMIKVLDVTDRGIMINMINLEATGVYSLGYKISNFTQMFITPFTLAWIPYAYRLKDQPGSGKQFSDITKLYFVVAAFLLSAVCLFRKELIYFFSPDYYEAYNVIGLLAFLNFIMGLPSFIGLGIPFKNKTYLFTIIGVVVTLVNFGASVALVKYTDIGIDGIAIGSLLGGVVWILGVFYFSQKLFKLQLPYITLSLVLVVPILFYFISPYIDCRIDSIKDSILLKGLITIVLMLIGFGLFSPLKTLKLFFKK